MELLTQDEKEALAMTAQLALRCRDIIGEGPTAATDWNDMAIHFHAIQQALMSQAAARAYPNEFRLMGRKID